MTHERLTFSTHLLPWCAALLLFAGHLSYGALATPTALLLCIGAAVLVLLAVARPDVRAGLDRLSGTLLPSVLFAATLAVGLFTLTPYGPGPHPGWVIAGIRPGAISADPSATAVELAKLLGLAAFVALGALVGSSDVRAIRGLRALIWVGAAYALWAMLAATFGILYQSQPPRLEATLLNPNTAGLVFGTLLLLSFGELRPHLRALTLRVASIKAVAASAFVALFLVALLATGSRGAFAATAAAFCMNVMVHASLRGSPVSRLQTTGIVSILIIAAMLVLFGDRVLGRLGASGEAAIVRIEIWRPHWQNFLEAPWFGTGLGTAETINKTLTTESNIASLAPIRAVLNVYLQWLEEAGLLGAAPMFLCIIALVILTWTAARRRSRLRGTIAILIAVDVLFALHGFVDFGLQVPSVAAFWSYLLGLQFAGAQSRGLK